MSPFDDWIDDDEAAWNAENNFQQGGGVGGGGLGAKGGSKIGGGGEGKMGRSQRNAFAGVGNHRHERGHLGNKRTK